jgi:hypothetical protein
MSNARRVVLSLLAAAILAGIAVFAQEVPPPRFITPVPELKIQAYDRHQAHPWAAECGLLGPADDDH